MSNLDTKQKIKAGLGSFSSADLTSSTINLFNILGYNTKRSAPLEQKTYKCFKDSFIEGNGRFDEKNALVNEWKYVDLLFQISKEEITLEKSLFDSGEIDNKIIESYLFFIIELNKSDYSRSVLSQITREINKLFPMPVMLLFKCGNLLTFAIINRRLHKRDQNRDVLEKVTLIRNINMENPHRAHIEILFDLSLEEVKRAEGWEEQHA